MNYRKYELLAAESIMTAGTKTIDLKGLDPISRINIQTLQTNASADLMAGHIAEVIVRVQIVDGSTVLYDSIWSCMQAQDWYQGRKTQMNVFYDYLEEQSRCNFTINFGRKLFDPELGFDPSRFKNPQLKIQHNHDLGGDTADTACTLRVEVDIWDEKIPSLIGFLQFKEIFSKAIVASGSEYIDLPVDLPIRSLMLQSLYASRNPTLLFNDIKITEDNGKRVVMEDNIREMLPNLPTFQLYRERIYHQTATGLRNIFCTPAYMTFAHGVGKNAYEDIYCQTNDGGRVQIGSVSGGNDALFIVEGYCPHGSISIPFGDPMDMTDWYDTSRLDKLQLKLTAGQYATDGQNQVVCLEQLVKY